MLIRFATATAEGKAVVCAKCCALLAGDYRVRVMHEHCLPVRAGWREMHCCVIEWLNWSDQYQCKCAPSLISRVVPRQ